MGEARRHGASKTAKIPLGYSDHLRTTSFITLANHGWKQIIGLTVSDLFLWKQLKFLPFYSVPGSLLGIVSCRYSEQDQYFILPFLHEYYNASSCLIVTPPQQ